MNNCGGSNNEKWLEKSGVKLFDIGEELVIGDCSPVEGGGQWSDLLEINHSRLFGTLIACIL